MKKRFISILLIFCISISLTPIIEVSAATMYSLSGNSMLSYRVVVKTSNISNAGTDAYLYAALSSATKTPVTDSGYNDTYHISSMESGDRFEKGDTDTCSLRVKDDLTLSPIYFQLAWVKNGLSAGWHCEWVEVQILKGGSLTATSGKIPVNKWFDTAGANFTAEIALKRTITGIGNFDNEYLQLTDEDHYGQWTATWDGMVTDNFHKESYNTYQYVGEPWFNWDVNDPNHEVYRYALSCRYNAVTIDKRALYEEMKYRGIHSLTIPIKINFNDPYTQGQLEWTKYIYVTGVSDVFLDLLYRPYDPELLIKQTDSQEYPDANNYGYPVQPTVSMFKQDSHLAVAAMRRNEEKPVVIAMDEECNPISEVTLNIPEDYDFYWGTILGEDNYYYTMVGYDNQVEDPNKTVIKIYKIKTDGEVIGTAEIKGRPANIGADQNMYASIRTPFTSSTGAMKYINGKLYLHISKQGFASAGVVHQANISYTVDTSTMSASFGIDGQTSYVSHSFNQKLIYDNKKVVTIDHGDAYPRALRLSVFNGSNVITKDIFNFTGDLGVNQTYHRVTGLEQSSSKYFVVGKSFPHNDNVPVPGYTNFNGDQKKLSYPQTVNIYLITVDKETLEYTHRWITTSNPSLPGYWSEPRLVPVGDDRFVLLYGYTKDSSNIYTQYQIVEADGRVSEPIKIGPMSFKTPVQPIIVGNSLYWLNVQTFEAYCTGAETGVNEQHHKATFSKLDITNINKPAPVQTAVNVSNNGEQYDLTVGATYYFDLSEYLRKDNVNMVNELPDKTLHYVPFTYAGTVNAYNLTRDTERNLEATLNVAPSDRSLFVSDYNIYRDLTWNSINSFALKSPYDIKYGMPYNNNYTLRIPSGGAVITTGYGYTAPSSNEWDAVISKDSSIIKNWDGIFSWCQDPNRYIPLWFTVRGYGSPIQWSMGCNSHNIDLVGRSVGYRPVLQVDSSKLTARDSLKAVTLYLTNGSFKGQSAITILSAESTYKAPSVLGLTDSSGATVTTTRSFSWNTSPDGRGKKYLPGATVPSSVTALYADWGTTMQQLKSVSIVNDKITSIDYTAFLWSRMVVAFYTDKRLIHTELYNLTGNNNIGEIDIPASANSIKVMMWQYNMDEMLPLGSPIKLVKENGNWSQASN
ncbi:MAG: PLAT/LH2 domain-containing protein [Eubacteriales bacterium]|nr:PLAT/LH2 domain-containing protein [Eubacteriales bacterium]